MEKNASKTKMPRAEQVPSNQDLIEYIKWAANALADPDVDMVPTWFTDIRRCLDELEHRLPRPEPSEEEQRCDRVMAWMMAGC